MNIRRADVEAQIADTFDRSECVIVGRATTGLKLVLDALSVEGKVIYPTYLCPSPVYASEYAGTSYEFCDVSSDYTIDEEDLKNRISDNIGAVVGVHTFGHPADIGAIQNLCSQHNAVLIEDACQAVGSKRDGWAAGSVGDVSLISFGSKKPIAADGGGAVLTDDEDLAAELKDAESDVPVRETTRLERVYNHYREIYYAIESLEEFHTPASKLFESFPEVFRELYMRGFDERLLPAISDALKELPEAISTRREHASTYRRLLDDPHITHPNPSGSPVYYRYSIALSSRDIRDFVVSYLRTREFHASTLYRPIHPRFGSTFSFPTAEELAARTVNLWVSPRVDGDYVTECAKAILEAIREYHSD